MVVGNEIHCKNILIASDYGSPQGRKRAIVGNYILPELSTIPPTHMNIIMNALGPPLHSTKTTIIDVSFPITLNVNDVTEGQRELNTLLSKSTTEVRGSLN